MEETTNKSELRKLAEFIHDLTWEALPEEVQKHRTSPGAGSGQCGSRSGS